MSFDDSEHTEQYRSFVDVSSPQTRHPTGDTPLTRHNLTTNDEPLLEEASRGMNTLPDLSRLMDMLDGDDPPPESSRFDSQANDNSQHCLSTREATRQSMPIETTSHPTPTQPEGSTPNRPTNLSKPPSTRRRIVPSTSTPPPISSQLASDLPSASTSAATSEAGSASPSVRASRSTSLRAQSAQSAKKSNRTLPNSHDSDSALEETRSLRDVLDAPLTPLQRSVLEELGLVDARGSLRYSVGATPQQPSRTLRKREPLSTTRRIGNRWEYTGHLEQEEGEELFEDESHTTVRNAQRFIASPGGKSEMRIAQEALREFDDIIAIGSPRTDRAPSRLRHIRSPFPESATPSVFEEEDYGTDDSVRRGLGTAERWREDVDQAFETDRSRTGGGETQHIIVAELKEANAYIAQLQSEIEAVTSIVMELKDDRSRERERLGEHHEVRTALSSTEQSELAVSRHLIALLPSLQSAAATTGSTLPSSASSLALAISFTRSIDSLVHNGPDGKERREEDVFALANVEKILKRIRKWERIVRDGS